MSQSTKQNHWNTSARVVAGLLLLVVTPVVADDVFPPSWRGQFLSITAEWDSWTNFPTHMPPDSYTALPPVPFVLPGYNTASVQPGGVARVNAFGRTNVLNIGGIGPRTWFDLMNYSDVNPMKMIWVQITYNANYGHPTQFQVIPDVGSTSIFTNWAPQYSTPPDANGWVTSAYPLWTEPNPNFERITLLFSGQSYVDQVVIDTWCTVPEPAGGLLVLLGSACLFGRGRRA